jgi:signal transduction histidine kinase
MCFEHTSDKVEGGVGGRQERERIIEEQASDIRGLVERDIVFKEADRHKNEFLAMLAHELRNPLKAASRLLGHNCHANPFMLTAILCD